MDSPRTRSRGQGCQVERHSQKLEVDTLITRRGPVLAVHFPAAGTPRDVEHGLEAEPNGFQVVSSPTPVYRAPGKAWTRQMAYLQADAVVTRRDVLVFFFVTSEDPLDA